MTLINITVLLLAIGGFLQARDLKKQQETIDAIATVLLEVVLKLGIEKLETVERAEIRRDRK